MFIFTISLISGAITLCIFLATLYDQEFKVSIITFIILIFCIGVAISSYHIAHEIDNKQYNNAVVIQQYEKTLDYVKGIYQDKIETKDRTYYINQDSKFKDTESLKLNQAIEIYYIDTEFNGSILINVNTDVK
jgi:hypothetical protein